MMTKNKTLWKRIPTHDMLFAGILIGVMSVIGFSIYQAKQSSGTKPSDTIATNAAQAKPCTEAGTGQGLQYGCREGNTKLPGFARRASEKTTYLAPGVKPPTNQWFSNLAFKQPSDPIFAYPLALQTLPAGFGVGYPQVVSTEKTVFGSYSPDLTADMGSVQTRVLSYDDLSVVMQARRGDNTVAEYRLTQGSPVVHISLQAGNSIVWNSPRGTTFSQKSGYYTATIDKKTYVLTIGDGASATISGTTMTIRASADAAIAVAILPADLADTARFIEAMQVPITGTLVGYAAGETAVTTELNIRTQSNKDSLMALVPAQQSGEAPGPVLGTYQTIMGVQKLYSTTRHSFTTPYTTPAMNLDTDKLTATERSEVLAALTADINNLDAKGFTASDSYFSGKQLARAANLMQLARNLGEDKLAQTAYDKLDAQMQLWLNQNSTDGRVAKYFYYDTTLKGLVGARPSFGSDTEFNDHHFHYGYFIYAAGYMADYKPEFGSRHAAVINALVRDIASGNRDDPYFPYLRPFDQYAGHSWASGTAPFADGNNNESSSEAVNAWYGLYLWAKATQNTQLETQARYLYARESHAALTYWTNFDRSQPQFATYKPSIVSMVWGGKLDYATWFSASSYAKLGIQILPVTPASAYLGADRGRVATNLSKLHDGSEQMFSDIVTMYSSFSDPTGAARTAKTLTDKQIDDGNSRSWLLAWVYTYN